MNPETLKQMQKMYYTYTFYIFRTISNERVVNNLGAVIKNTKLLLEGTSDIKNKCFIKAQYY